MKYNLKNFPRQKHWSDKYPRGKIAVWIQGFEAELREKISNIEKAACIYNSWTMARHLKEILGE